MQPRRHSLPVANTTGDAGTHELVFYDWGDVNAQRVSICVHGLTRNAHDFDYIAPALAAKGRRVFALNMAGRGESAWLENPMGYNYASYVADCLAFMDNFHLRGVEWIGTSMGGIIGMMLAAYNPGRIRKLVLNDVGIHLSKASLLRIFDYVRNLPASFTSRAEADAYMRTVFKPFGITDETLWATFVDHSLLTKNGTLHYACDPAIAVPLAAASQNFTEVTDINLADLWEKIDVPTLILRGAESDILTFETVQAMRSTHVRAQSQTFDGVGHAPALMTDDQIKPVVSWLTTNADTMLASGL